MQDIHDELNPYESTAESPLLAPATEKRSFRKRFILLGLLFLAVTYLIAYPGGKPPVSFGMLLLMIPAAPFMLFSGIAIPDLGSPLVVGVVLSALTIAFALVCIVNLFRDDAVKQSIAVVTLGLLNGLMTQVCFFIAHGHST